jgi:hypothetical protein
MKSNNYITGFGWMFNELNLKGNEAWIFALIYGFCQDGKSTFEGSLSYIQQTLNLSRNTVINTLDKLERNNHIVKHQILKNSVPYNSYSLGSSISALGSAKNDKKVVQKMTEGSSISAPNNTIDNTNKIFIDKASEFLKKNYPVRFEQEFERRFKKQFPSVESYDSFLEDFNLTWDGKEFPKNLFGMLIKYAKNKVRFLKDTNTDQIKIIRPEFKRIG